MLKNAKHLTPRDHSIVTPLMRRQWLNLLNEASSTLYTCVH
jgi:hypothetical protein